MPRDESYLDEDSALWRVHRERLVRLSAPRALLLQASHPLVWAGLLGHGRALAEAHDRLNRTAAALGVAAFGPRPQADRVGARVKGIHRHTRGVLEHDAGRFPAGTPYEAEDPALLLWVLAPIADSAMVVHDRLVRPLPRDERDALWQDYRVLGAIFGLATADTPATIEEFDAYMDGMLAGGDLHVAEQVRKPTVDAALRPRVPLRARPLVAAIRVITAGLLPPRLRREYGLGWGPGRERALTAATWGLRRAVVPLLPDRLRDVPVREAPAPRPAIDERSRPQLVGHVRPDGDAVVVAAGAVELRVEGEPELARRILALCDGERSLGEILDQAGARDARDDVYELVGLLVERGALRDGT